MLQQIPGFDLSRQNRILKHKLSGIFIDVMERGKFILGEEVARLEEEIAAFCDVKYGIGVASGSDALYLALLACGVGLGTEVITTPFSFFATAGAIARTGAVPVFTEIDPVSFNLDPTRVEEKITPRTRAILPVHLYGCPVEMAPLVSLARRYGLAVIEDAAQALGAAYKGKKAGALGDAACFSFFPTKNLGAFGDGGMVVTQNVEIASRVRLLREHGAREKYRHDFLGCNSRLDELQAAILRVKFTCLERWNRRRREIATLYGELLSEQTTAGGNTLKLPFEPGHVSHVYHQYTIQTESRNALQAYLREHGVGSTVYYPLPLHLQKAFSGLGYRPGDFPLAEEACNHVLSLPMFPELTGDEIRHIVGLILRFFKK